MKKLLTIFTFFLFTEIAMASIIDLEDKVRSIVEKGEKYEVTFSMHAARYHILKGSAQEKSLLPVLRKRLSDKEPVELKVDSDTHELMSLTK